MTTFGVKALRQIQMNREDTQGTATTDYTPWRGTGSLEDMIETVFPEEDIGIFGGVDRSYIPKSGGQIVLEGVATYKQMPHIFDAAIYAATATTDASSAFIRTWTFPIVTSDAKVSTDLMTYSFKFGDNAEVEQAHFGFIPEFGMSGTAGEAVNVSATFQTRAVSTDSAGFETVSIPAVEEMLFSKGKLYLDAYDGTIGSTQVSNTLLSADLKVTTGWMGVYAADGRVDFGFLKQTQPEVVLEVTFEHNDTAMAEKTYWRAGTTRLLQLLIEGTALTDAVGGTYAVKAFVVNLAGKWEKFSSLDEQDGNDIVTGTFRARYNSDSGRFAQFIVANETETMPG